MKNYFKYTIASVIAVGMFSCEPEFENSVEDQGFYSNGDADFSTYVSVGNSLTAGYADNALYKQGQENSFPNIVAHQLKHVGGGDFTQPLMNDNLGGLLFDGQVIATTRLVLGVDAEGNPTPKNIAGAPSTEITQTLTGTYNNMGVPGAKSFHLLLEGYGNAANLAIGKANPYFVRFRSSENATVIGDAVKQNPSFFSLWIGNNDVLSYATSGGAGTDQTGNLDPSTYGANDITDPNVFASVYSQEVDALMQSATSGVLINIPNVAYTPYFTTVPYAPLDPSNPSFGPMIPQLNETYGMLNNVFAYLNVPERSIVFSETAANPVVIKDEDLTDLSTEITQVLMANGLNQTVATLMGMQYGQARQATPEDLLVLTSRGVIGELNQEHLEALLAMNVPQEIAAQLSVNGITYPLTDQWVLTNTEQAIVNQATAAYNAVIEGLATAKNLAFVDANAMMEQLANGGITYDGGMVTSAFATGGAFSLDGIHLTPRGNAIMANYIIRALNETYNATVPVVNVGNYSGTPALGATE
ncbi:lysophospholipase L1-like esterase [Mesonia hippocampi]|uniref:Lysophospholipase L1-like esterase n=1 Tax=Mesonia hippocampi TaxID=1628250 RepID=A0A840ENW3_9FLAO|nr:G-D-S-L family lipolytic protein [Mesonia hippocampi]MBB4118751.1 lysophospholipase L1-like esterase [Mesonia hippocampi]